MLDACGGRALIILPDIGHGSFEILYEQPSKIVRHNLSVHRRAVREPREFRAFSTAAVARLAPTRVLSVSSLLVAG